MRQYQVQVDPVRLPRTARRSATSIRAVRESNQEAGGSSLEIAGHEYVIRGRGYVRDARRPAPRADARRTNGRPVYLGDVAEVSFGPAPRRGIVELDGEGEVVGGIVVMRSEQNALAVIDGVKERLAELRAGLPGGRRDRRRPTTAPS